jgi:uncharacterized membrane protein
MTNKTQKKMKKEESSSSKEIEEGKLCSVLAYLLIGIVWYFADDKMKKNSLANFHVKQGIVFLIATLIYDIILGIVLSIILIPFAFTGFGWGLIGVLRLLYYIPLIFLIIGIVNSLNGNKKELPIIGHWGKKFNF